MKRFRLCDFVICLFAVVFAASEKDTKRNWKIRAIDFCDKDLIKEIKTPKPE